MKTNSKLNSPKLIYSTAWLNHFYFALKNESQKGIMVRLSKSKNKLEFLVGFAYNITLHGGIIVLDQLRSQRFKRKFFFATIFCFGIIILNDCSYLFIKEFGYLRHGNVLQDDTAEFNKLCYVFR